MVGTAEALYGLQRQREVVEGVGVADGLLFPSGGELGGGELLGGGQHREAPAGGGAGVDLE